MSGPAYQVQMPEARTTSVVFASPHSGRNYPLSFLRKSVLDEQTIRSSEDAFVDLLFEAVPGMGSPLLTALAPRAFIDVNRSADELDPALIEGVRKIAHNPRVASGLGVIPRVVANGRAIYRGKLSRNEADARLSLYWAPYHAALERLLSESLAAFGEAVLIDCHSMPHEAIESLSHPAGRPDIVLGDRFGAAPIPRWSTGSRPLLPEPVSRSPATPPSRGPSSPSITAARRAASMWFRSRSTGRST